MNATKRSFDARAVVMNRARDQFLACAGLTVNEHGAVHRRHQFERGEERLHRAVAADDVLEAELAFELRLELGVLLAQTLLLEPGRAARATSCESWNGLIRKSTAPRLIAVTASATPPNPVITTARISG